MKPEIMIPVICLIFIGISCQPENRKNKTELVPDDPNILLIITDDLGWGDIHYNGNDIIETPNLDQLASESLGINRFYVSPAGASTRASLLTGRYHLRTGVYGITGRKEVMRDTEYTMAELFRNNDYSTACFGKWHNGAQFPHNPIGQGFEYFFGFCADHVNQYHDPVLEYQGRPVETKGYIADILTDSAISYIENQDNNSFFAYVAYNTPHTPSQVPEKYFNKYKDKGLDDFHACTMGMCENIDDNVGRLIQCIKENGLTDNTIVIFLSDNGPDSQRFNGKMKGKKGSVDEGGVRVPFFLKIPWINTNKKEVNQLTAHIDIMPTLASLCKLELPEGLVIDGQDIGKMYNHIDKEESERLIFTHQGMGSYIPYAVRSDKYLLTVKSDTLLFDLINDPGQETDFSPTHPEIVINLLKSYQKWYREVSRFGFDRIPIHIGYKNLNKTVLPAHEAILSKNLDYYGAEGRANDWVKNFRSHNDTISWKIMVIKDDNYRIEVKLDSPVQNKGMKVLLDFDELFSETILERSYNSKIIDTKNRFQGKEVPEKSWDILVFDNVHLPVGTYMLNLCLENTIPSNIEVKGIEIIKKH